MSRYLRAAQLRVDPCPVASNLAMLGMTKRGCLGEIGPHSQSTMCQRGVQRYMVSTDGEVEKWEREGQE